MQVKFSKVPNKVEKIIKGSLDSIPSPSPLVKIQIMGGKVYLMSERQNITACCQHFLKTKMMLSSPSNVLPYYLK